MGRKRFDEMNCGVAQALEALGDCNHFVFLRNHSFRPGNRLASV
jgi:hypothetical protein